MEGEDLNQDGIISILQGEIFDFAATFSGDSSIDPFTIGIANLVRPPTFQRYVYGSDLYDTADDIFFGGASPGFFVGEGRYIEFSVANDYQNTLFSTVITQFDNPDFLGLPTGMSSTARPTVFTRIVKVPEPGTTAALLAVGLAGACCRKLHAA